MAVYKRDLVDINLENGNIHRSFLSKAIGSQDQQADHFGVRVFRDGEPVNLTGVSVQGVCLPPHGGAPITITSGNIVNYNEAEVVLPQACYNYDGQFTLAIKLVDPSNSVTGTMRIVDGMVDNTNASGTVAPVAAIPSYQEVLSTYEQAIAAINKTVRFDAMQSLTDTQKATARDNISAASVAELQAEAAAREDADTAVNNKIGTVPSGKTLQGQIDTLESGKVPKTTTVNGHALSANVTVTKADVGLGNVDNTSDANKPVSTAQQAAIDDLKSAINNVGVMVFAWEQGRYKADGGTASSTYTIRTNKQPVTAGDQIMIDMDSGHYLNVAYWQDSNTIIELGSTNLFGGDIITIPTNCTLISLNCRVYPYSTSNVIYPSYGENVSLYKKNWLYNGVINKINDVNKLIEQYNAKNVIPVNTSDKTDAGITLVSNKDGSYTISGTASGDFLYVLNPGTGAMPEGWTAGKEINLTYNGYDKVRLQVWRYISGTIESRPWIDITGEVRDARYTLGSDVTSVLVRLKIDSGTAISTAVTVFPVSYLLGARSNKDLTDDMKELNTEYFGKVADSAYDSIREQFDTLVASETLDFTEQTLSPWSITTSNKWAKAGTGQLFRSYVVELPKHTTAVKIIANNNENAIIAFLKTYSYPPTSGDTPDYGYGTSRIVLPSSEKEGYYVTENMKYLYVNAIDSDGNDRMPTVVVFSPKGGTGSSVINYNTYNITVEPEITTDTNGWLQPIDTESESETGKTDMTAAIMAMLTSTGYCHLAEGIFYVSGNIEMPAYSRIEGCGFGTKIKLLDGEDATVLAMDTHCSIENLWISGAYNPITLTGTIGSRNAISYAKSTNRYGIINNCKISGFTGAGILMQDTSTPVDRCACISNSFIRNCNVGIYIRKDCEFNKITNCTIVSNYYGYLNRGGNNDISNCGIDANVVCAQIDDDEGSNNGHGTITGCSFNHANSNTGYGLIIKGTGSMLVTNCNFYYAKIRLENTNGNVISNCGFGRSSGLEISGAKTNGGCNMIIGCMMREKASFPITVTDNTDSVMINCYDRAGEAVTFPE